MMPTHDYFRELAALAEVGEISEKEHAELQAHLRSCPECRHVAEQYRQVLFDWLPLRGSGEAERQRDIQEATRWPRSRARLASIVPVAAVLVVCTALSLLWTAQTRKESRELKQALDASRSERSALLALSHDKEQRILALQKALADQDRNVPPLTDPESGTDSLTLQQAHARLNQLQAETDELRSRQGYQREEFEKLNRELGQARAVQQSDQKRSSDLEARVRQLQGELEKRETRIKGLTDRLAFLDARIRTESDKKAAASDGTLERLFRDPSLEVTNVYAISNKSAKPGSFCRILQVAGGPPVIYAFRLTTGDFSAPGAQRHFQIWGLSRSIQLDSLGLANPAQSGESSVRLGELSKDDLTSDRWVLQLPDAKALNGIGYLLITEGRSNTSALPARPILWGYVDK